MRGTHSHVEPRSVGFPTGTTVVNVRNWHRRRTARSRRWTGHRTAGVLRTVRYAL